MFVIIAIQLIYSIVCVYLLIKKLDLKTHVVSKVFYALASFSALVFALGFPLIINDFDSLMRGFFLYISLYLIIISVLIPDQIVKDKDRTSLIRISNYILINYIVIYIPILMLNIANTLNTHELIVRTIILTFLFLLSLFSIRYVRNLFKKYDHKIAASTFLLVVAVGTFLLTYEKIGEVDVLPADTRNTNDVYFDDDYYIVNEYSIEISEVGSHIYDFAYDNDYLYLLSKDSLAQTVFVSLLDINTLNTVKTYEFYPNNVDYSWYINTNQDFVFNQNDTIYFTFIDGIYTIDETKSTKISDISDITSNKFLYNDEFHIISKDETQYNIYRFKSDHLELIDTIVDTENDLEVASANNYLYIKNRTDKEIIVYPNVLFSIPEIMINYDVLTVNSERIIFSDDQNSELLDDGILAENFSYYSIDKYQKITLINSDDYMFNIEQYSFESSSILFETLEDPKTYDYDFKDIELPTGFVDDLYKSEKYTVNQEIVKKDGIMYWIFYRIHDYDSNQIHLEISEVKELVKTKDLGVITDFTKESFLIVILIALLFSGNSNLELRIINQKKP